MLWLGDGVGPGLEGGSESVDGMPGTRHKEHWLLGPGEESCSGWGSWGYFFVSLCRALCKSFSWETGSPACQVRHRE